jgi:hypothetical protein
MCALKNANSNVEAKGSPSGSKITYMSWGPHTTVGGLTLESSRVNLLDVANIHNYSDAHNEPDGGYLYTKLKDGNSWKVFNQSMYNYGELGANPLAFGEIGARKLKSSDIPFAVKEKINIELNEGDIIPFGKYNTLMAMYDRNTVLTDSIFMHEAKINIPVSTNRMSEMDSLDLLLESLDNTYTDESSVLYGHPYAITLAYPLMSRAYAYRPYKLDPITGDEEKDKNRVYTIEVNPEFDVHNWWVPSIGEYLRLYYYVHAYDAFTFDKNNRHDDDDIFTPIANQALADKNDPLLKDTQYKLVWEDFKTNIYSFSSTEYASIPPASAYALYLTGEDIYVSGMSAKAINASTSLRPICQF